MRRTSRYPTRSSVNRAQNSGGTASINNNISVPERRSERTRSQTDRLGTATSQSSSSHDYSRMHHQQHGHPPPQANHAHSYIPYQPSHQLQPSRQHMLPNGQGLCSVQPNITITTHTLSNPAFFRTNFHNSMPRINDITQREIKFIKLNSFDEIKCLIKTRSIPAMVANFSQFQLNESGLTPFLVNDQYRIFLRFCKYSSSLAEQNDCLPKSFNLIINQAAFQVKNKYTFAPYDITTRIACEKSNDIAIRISIDPNSNETNEEFSYGLFLVKKVDHKKLVATFKNKVPHDPKFTLDLVKKKLNPDDDSDDIAIVENADQIKVSLLCPLSSTRIKYPARSKHCDHVLCFDAESFISINEITPRWKCPICKVYIKLEDMIIDGLMTNILRNAPAECNEAEILADGKIEYIYEAKSNASPTKLANNGTEQPSTAPKRKLEEEPSEKKSVASKVQKVEKEIECITLDSDDETSNSDTIETNNNSPDSNLPSNENSNNKDDESDDEIEIIFEKLVTKNPVSNNSQPNHTKMESNSNSNSSSSGAPYNGSNNNQSSTSTPSMPQFNSNAFNSHRSFSSQSSSHHNSNYNNHHPTNSSSSNEVPNNISWNMYAHPYQNSSSGSGFGMNGRGTNNNSNFMQPHGNMYSAAGTSNASSYTMSTGSSSRSSGHSLLSQNAYSSTNSNYMDSFMPPSQMASNSMHNSSTNQNGSAVDLTSAGMNIKTDTGNDPWGPDTMVNEFWINKETDFGNSSSYLSKQPQHSRAPPVNDLDINCSPLLHRSQSMPSNFSTFHSAN